MGLSFYHVAFCSCSARFAFLYLASIMMLCFFLFFPFSLANTISHCVVLFGIDVKSNTV
jgi:hypothetical protein